MSRCGQGLAAVQQRAQNIGSVDLDFGILRQFLVGPYSLGQAGNGSSSLADAPVLVRRTELEYQRLSSQSTGKRSHVKTPVHAPRL